MESIVNGYANALLTFAHAESTAEFNLITEFIFTDKILKLLYDLT
jgi:hypothetical protein